MNIYLLFELFEVGNFALIPHKLLLVVVFGGIFVEIDFGLLVAVEKISHFFLFPDTSDIIILFFIHPGAQPLIFRKGLADV